MAAISWFFSFIVSAVVTLFSVGLHEVFLYEIGRSKKTVKVKNALNIVCHIIFAIGTFVLVIVGIRHLTEWLCSTNLGRYIAVIIYTLLLALMATNILYISPSVEVDSSTKAFRKGFTSASVNHIIPNLFIKTIINLFYLIVLILSQIEDLGFASFSSGISYFCTLNKYGIVIVFAVEKIIKSLAPEKKRMKILTETLAEQDKQEEREREERKSMKTSKKKLKIAKKQAKKERKKNK